MFLSHLARKHQVTQWLQVRVLFFFAAKRRGTKDNLIIGEARLCLAEKLQQRETEQRCWRRSRDAAHSCRWMWADVETGGYQGRPKLCMWSLSFIAFSYCLKRKTNLVGSGVVSSRERAPEKRARATESWRDGQSYVSRNDDRTSLRKKKIMFWTWLSGLIRLSGTSMQIGTVEMVLKPGCHRSWQDVISMADISLSKPLMCEIWIITSSALAVWITQLCGHALLQPWPCAQLAFPILTLKWWNRRIYKLQFTKE